MKQIDFYFDFTSPYAYLAHYRLPGLADRYGCQISYKPVDLRALKMAAGNTGPATVQIPLKLRYVMADIGRWVRRYSAPFNVGKRASFESERANKGTFFAIEKSQAREYVIKLWQMTYGAGGSMDNDELFIDVARELGWRPQVFLDFVNSEEAHSLYEQSIEDAHKRGVFGVPTAVMGDEMWWGNDRLDFLEEYLAVEPVNQSSN